MKLVVGLGNPGKKYQTTKHNLGFMALDSYANIHKFNYKKSIRFNAEIYKNSDVIYLKPKTFMNNSGVSVRKVCDYYNIESDNVLIIFDDLNLPFGKIRLRKNGSASGHNGIKSIISHLNTENFKRLRLGIERNINKEMKEDVLQDFSKSELKSISETLIDVANIIDDFIAGNDFENLMNRYN